VQKVLAAVDSATASNGAQDPDDKFAPHRPAPEPPVSGASLRKPPAMVSRAKTFADAPAKGASTISKSKYETL